MTHVRLFVALVALLVMAGLPPAMAQQPPAAPPGGAPPAGRGPYEVMGFVRVWDGDTIDVRINGTRVLVGLIGIDAPMGNTPCGREAAARLRALVRGGVRLEEDPALTFDARGRRL